MRPRGHSKYEQNPAAGRSGRPLAQWWPNMTALPLDLVVLILSFSPRLVFSIGESCLVSGNRLDPLTARFLSACDFTEYCVSNKGSNDYSTCQERRCRSDTWPPK